MRSFLVFTFFAFSAAPAWSQPKAEPKPGDAMINAYLAAETDKLSPKFLDGAKTLEEWKAKRPRLYREYLDMLGLWPLPEKTPLNATITRTFENQGIVIDNLHYQSRPGLYVTANLYRPKGNTKKLPTILYVCGHTNKGRDGNKSAFQDHGLWFAANGYNCLVLDTLQLGEIPGIHHGTYNKDRWWWHSAGYAPSAVECWNGVRGTDYLLSRSDVDPDKLGVTGISGGGAATIWIAAADDRVKVAVPVSGMADLESYVKNKVVNGHCDCMFLYNTYQWEWTTILALIAPRPMLFANSDKDSIFPMDANRRIAARMRTLYGLYGKESLTDEYVSSGGHAYRPDLRVAVFKFLNKHLKGDTTSPVEDSASFKEIPGKELRVFPTNEDLPKDILNGKIDETFVPRAIAQELPRPEEFLGWQRKFIQRIRDRSFRALPADIPAAVFKEGDKKGQILTTDAGVEVMLLGADHADTLIVIGDDVPDAKWLERFPGAALFGTRGSALRGEWTKKSPPNTVARSHILLGQTVDQKRVFDIIAVAKAQADKLKKKESLKASIKLIGRGEQGILAAYAALFEPCIGEVVVVDPPLSHQNGPHFPGILREIEIPDALGLLAPRPLTIVGEDRPFGRTVEMYFLTQAGAKVKFEKN
jgi:dienelactone hydrolase